MAIKKRTENKTDKAASSVVDPFATVADVQPKPLAEKKPSRVSSKKVSGREAVSNIDLPAIADAPPTKPAAKKRVAKSPSPGIVGVDAFAQIAETAASNKATKTEIPVENKVEPKRGREASKTSRAAIQVAPETAEKKKRVTKTAPKRRAPAEVKSSEAFIETATLRVAPPDPIQAKDNTNEREQAVMEPEVELSPVFKALAEPKLPELPRENRARLQMQSPTRLYLYWSLRTDPWQQLRAVFGADLGSYSLVVKLRNVTRGTEQIERIESEGEWWFNDVEPGCEYMGEIGFYAVNRPYFRVLYSNSITTPRRSPSPHPAAEARWTVSATKFADVLDASGFSRDAVDVAIAGDDHLDAEHRTRLAFSEVMGKAEYSTRGIPAEDLRYALLAIAGGATIIDLRGRVSSSLFETLQSKTDLSPSSAREALASHFEIDETEWIEHEFGPAVFGASLVNFPKTLTPRKDVKYSPRYNPVSSFSIGR